MNSSEESTKMTGTPFTLSTTAKRMLLTLKSIHSASGHKRGGVSAMTRNTPNAPPIKKASLTHPSLASSTDSLLSMFLSTDASHGSLDSARQPLNWYISWSEEQLKQLPSATWSVVIGHDVLHTNTWSPQLRRIVSEIATFTTTS